VKIVNFTNRKNVEKIGRKENLLATI